MPDSAPPRYDLGDCTVTLLSGGRLRLDGGAMFGLIPKAVWSRVYPTDEQNRILLACNCLLVEWPGRPERLLVETGHGAKYSEKEQRIFAINPRQWLLPALTALNIAPESITDVVLTHLHFDHAGGLTHERDGQCVPTFPRARVHVQRAEYEDARANFGIMHASYRAENLTPLPATAWQLLDGAALILPGVRVRTTPGHTRGHQTVLVEGARRVLAYAGDVLPTRHHLGAPYNMGYDLFPLENRASKQALLAWLAARDGLLVLDHEVDSPVSTVRAAGDWFSLSPEPAHVAES
jgi:glyoxylase-like metal-dependent hydrolase (beta-lactamase superfamily II)